MTNNNQNYATLLSYILDKTYAIKPYAYTNFKFISYYYISKITLKSKFINYIQLFISLSTFIER